ncbi:MAG: pyridoxamine 5'-phosphate oxidase family protein [Ferruginibacter sp.]|nr:pyridoxamine 5'-phosphate oxidase family protein [Ferruginibacter sp.]
MNQTIIQFLQKQTGATVSCVDEKSRPYCFSCFYAFNFEEGLLYYKSSSDTHHAQLMNTNPFIAGTVLPDKLNKLVVKGIQFEGIILEPSHSNPEEASSCYYKKHPLALAVPGIIWAIQINHIKMTDSTLGFGKKITWGRDEEIKICV